MAEDGCGVRGKQVEKSAQGLTDKFNELIKGGHYGINLGRLESANAGFPRIRSKCCILFDIDWLLGKMHRI